MRFGLDPAPASPTLRHIAVPRPALLGAVAGGALLLAWAGVTTWYILARDEVAAGFFARQTELRYAYEDRIGVLSARLEREITQNMVERSGQEARIRNLAERQAAIEARQRWIAAAADRAARHGVAGPLAAKDEPAPARAADTAEKPAPIPDEFGLRLGDRGASPAGPDVAVVPTPRDRLSALQDSLTRVAAADTRLVEALGAAARARIARLRTALDATGLELDRRMPGREGGQGGPLVPLPATTLTGVAAVDATATALELQLAELDRLASLARTLPLGRPVPSDAEVTSGFGVRLDPFTRGPALHTGVDFREAMGAPVRATAAGRVVSAEWTGGYGNMVEIDHGGGLTTRYGHLSAYLVSAGDRVEAGQAIARVGSTGRSTGAHVHYETRINGEPVNPVRFLEAGRVLASASD
ncbi:MAG: M23 family metallopeptidase [Methylobacteriaceae bacterium]|nr:M23 family metallopeptidase [Methylobacteriaceae bacterium]